MHRSSLLTSTSLGDQHLVQVRYGADVFYAVCHRELVCIWLWSRQVHRHKFSSSFQWMCLSMSVRMCETRYHNFYESTSAAPWVNPSGIGEGNPRQYFALDGIPVWEYTVIFFPAGFACVQVEHVLLAVGCRGLQG